MSNNGEAESVSLFLSVELTGSNWLSGLKRLGETGHSVLMCLLRLSGILTVRGGGGGGGEVFLQLTKPVSQRLVLVPSPVLDS
jgi:hypothetical protein